MDEHLVEFVTTSGVIKMNVAGHHFQRFVQQLGQVQLEAGYAQASIDQHVSIASAHEPNICSVEPMVVWLGDKKQIVTNTIMFKPMLGNLTQING